MDNKVKDTIFSIMMFLLGGYVVVEGVRMYFKAASPPYRITDFSVSPALLPVVLGVGLVILSVILFIKSFVGEKKFFKTFGERMSIFAKAFVAALKTDGMKRMIVGVIFMAILVFGLMGRVSFVIGGTVFMFATMLFLKATKWWKSLIFSVVAMALIFLLFQVIFKTPLP